MTSVVSPEHLHRWCSIPVAELAHHDTRIPYRIVTDAAEMGHLMARDLVEVIEANNSADRDTRAIVPCGPVSWYEPFAQEITSRAVSLRRLEVFHMDEMLDWQGRPLPTEHPLNFRTYMERHFYDPIPADLRVPETQRHWLLPKTAAETADAIMAEPVDIVLGGWGQDGHVAYNQARRHPFSQIAIDEIRGSTIRIQDNNVDTVLALAHRSLGGAYQFVPPMSITLGMRECLQAKRIRLYSDTGPWKQTAFRVALFAAPTAEYPITLLQEHPDVLLTATVSTASHVISDHPEWVLFERSPTMTHDDTGTRGT